MLESVKYKKNWIHCTVNWTHYKVGSKIIIFGSNVILCVSKLLNGVLMIIIWFLKVKMHIYNKSPFFHDFYA